MSVRLLILLFCLLTALSCRAETLALDERQTAIRLGPQLEYLVDSNNLDFAGASRAEGWRAVAGSSLSFGHQPQPVWVRLALRNTGATSDWLLQVEWSIIDLIEVRVLDAQGRWGPLMQAGDHLSLSAWPRAGRQPEFPLLLAQGETQWVYLRLHSDEALVAPMQLIRADHWYESEMLQRTLLGMFFGAMLAVLLYNLSLYCFTRSADYIWYILYLLGVVGYELSLSGFGVLYLWPELGRPAGIIYAFSAIWSFFAATAFVRIFLRFRHYGGWVLWSNNLLLAYWGLALVLLFIYPRGLQWIGATHIGLLSGPIALTAAISLWRRGNRSAPLFTLAWSALIVCTMVHLGALQGLLPVNQLTLRIQTLGFFSEFVLLSVALANRINLERAARIEAQKQTLETQRRANEELERRVQLRTRELQQARQALEEANGELTRLSYTDALTRLANRRYVDEQLPRLGCEDMAVLMLDIDHFKQINDRYGHPFGDRCIAAVAEVLHEQVRRSDDTAARYGGEEFIVLLPGCPQPAATAIAERIRAAVAALELAHEGQAVRFTVSIGVAQGVSAAGQPRELIGRADQALYRAKQDGRNRYCVAH